MADHAGDVCVVSLKLIDHHLATRDGHLPPVDEAMMLDYVVGAGGIFARGRRPGMEVCIPIAEAPVRGLRGVQPYVQFGYPKVPAHLLGLVFSISQTVAKAGPREALFHLSFEPSANPVTPLVESNPRAMIFTEAGWRLEFPRQTATADHVETLDKGAGSSEARAVIEVHSHHEMDPVFSPTDDTDEGMLSFRLYGVIGNIFSNPSIRVRVGLFGYFYEYPAGEFFELPEGVTDVVSSEQKARGK